MKLRQKLAVAMATAMAFSAVPVVTMADSTNKIQRASEIVKKDTKTTSAAYKIQFDDYDGEEEFYFTLTNAEWLKFSGDDAAVIDDGNVDKVVDEDTWVYNLGTGKATYYRQSDKVMRVKFVAFDDADVEDKYTAFPLPVKLTGGSASVALTAEGSDSTLTEKSFTFASTGEKAATLDHGDYKSFYDKGELTKLILKETYVESLNANDLLIKIQLDDEDWEFEVGSKVTIKGTYGFSGEYNSLDDKDKVELLVDEDDKSTAYLWISKNAFKVGRGASLGRIEITGIEVDSDEKDLAEGDLKADITRVASYKGKVGCDAELDQDYNDYVVAKIANYGAYIKMKDDKAVDIIAGRDEETVFEVIENVDDVFIGGHQVVIDLEDDTTDKDDYKDSYFWIKNDPDAIKKLIDDDPREIVDKVTVVWHDDKAPKAGDEGKADAIKVTFKSKDKDGKAIHLNDEIDKFKVKVMTYVPVGQMDKKELKFVAESRGVEFKEATAVNIIKPFDVKFDTTTLKVGLQDQKMNDITITETDKARFMKGSIVFDIVEGSKDQSGITIEEKGEHTVTGELKKTDLSTNDKDQDRIKLNRQSKSASSITISGMEVTVDRTVPEGFYDLKLSGDAIDEHGGDISYDDLIKIGTANTQDITNANGLAAATAVFTIDSTKYTVNGIEYDMDAPAYIAGSGSTMIPMRYMAYAFGVAPENILFSNGTATFFAGSRTIQLTTGSDVALVNGAPIKMAVKVENKNGRLFVPVGEVANILSVSKSWDPAAKTATFSNVNTAK